MRGRGNSSPRANSRGGHGGSNYHNPNFRGGRGSNHHNPRANFRGGRGRGRGGDHFVERPNFRDRRDGGNYGEAGSFRDEYNIPPKLSIPKIKELQQRTTIANFSSSKLTYGGSDQLVFIVNGERITTVWKKKLEETPWYQDDIRIFICSALVTADSQKAGELVTRLSNPKSGRERLSEIMKFPMSCDAGLQPGVLSFQYVILPLLGLLTRTAITKCTLEKHVDDIFMVVYEELDYINVMKMLETLVQRNSIKDRDVDVDTLLSHERYSFIPYSLGVFFLIIVRFLAEMLRRVREASTNETMHKIFQNLQELKAKYRRSIEQQLSFSISTDPLINNSNTREYFFAVLDDEMRNIIEMLVTYDVPNESSNDEERHDDDFGKISIIPTIKEILCDRPLYLPSLSHSSPNGAARLLDRQFRLLREDMLNPIRGGISNFLALLSRNYYFSLNNNGRLSDELENVLYKNKGKFKYDKGMNHDNGDLNVYTDIEFAGVGCDRKNGLICTLKFAPFNNSTNAKRGSGNWKNSKRLLPGNLIALLLPNPNSKQAQSNSNNNISMSNFDLYSTYFGIIMSRDEVIEDERIRIYINFHDPSIYPIALNEFHNPIKENNSKNSYKVKSYMVESTNIYYEAYCHVLKILQTTNPASLPFKRYLAPALDHHLESACMNVEIKPPKYTIAPGFQFDLSVLCSNNKQQNLRLNVTNTNTYDEVAQKINEYSKLDKSQAKALVSALTREIALIEGPPGTGKTVVGVEIMKVLLAEKNRINIAGPILTICFTNHALDQFLEHLLDDKITEKIVRLGSRTKSERIKKFTLGKLRPNNSGIPLTQIFTDIEDIENDVEEIIKSTKNHITWKDVSKYLKKEEDRRKFFNKFSNVTHEDLPNWVLGTNNATEETDDEEDDENSETSEKFQDSNAEEIDEKNSSDEETEESQSEFQEVRRKQQKSIFERWLRAEDIRKIDERKKHWADHGVVDLYDDDYDEKQFSEKYNKPKTNRSLYDLLNNSSIWEMAIEERKKLHDFWRAKHDEEKLSSLQKEHEECRQELNDIYDEERRQILLNSDVIGMTTSGAAKLQNLIKYIDPKIIICEEAGEVLEAHILSALTPSTQHLILIGDHNQLRPHVATYSLSIESYIGENYQLDKSLFERFVDGTNNTIKIEKTRLLTQRRMRGEISDLIRYTIYDDLEDGESTTEYPNVSGVQHNVYFIDHNYPEEDCGSDLAMQSHVNIYEVRMVVEMVKYFVKYGYTKPKDIAVLTPYLGQMIKIKEALSESFIVDIDERDAQNIADMEQEESDTPKSLNHEVKLRTVDNFQGEEANIVIISLVRNYSDSKYNSIGFLKSKNRSNVLLSRAREGMYLIGNSELMASKSEDMWAPVVNILRKRNQIGPGIPIECKHHPDCKNIIKNPEQFDEVCSPTGGCRSTCDMPLSCGHTCANECHFDNLEHKRVKCRKPCNKLHTKCGHQCSKLCYKDCGKCNVPVGEIILPCRHMLQNAECWENQNKEIIRCNTIIDTLLPDCGHPLQNIECWRVQNKEKFTCHFPVNITLPNCGHPLKDVECWKVKNGEEFICYFLTDIMLPCGHVLQNARCWKNKSKETLKCHFLIDIILTDCGHPLQNVECCRVQSEEKFTCNFPIDITLPCGHTLQDVKCWKSQNKETIECSVPIDIELPGCGHILQNVGCWRNKDKENIKCKSSIDVELSCGHILKDVECWRNKHRQLPKCGVSTDIALPCGHILQNVECHKNENREEIECNALVDIMLPCGHIVQNVECWKNKYKGAIKCNTTIDIILPNCGHPLQNIECWRVQNEEEFTCNFPIDITLPDCGHTLNVKCCKKENIRKCNYLVVIELPCGHTLSHVECWKKDKVKIKSFKCSTSIDFVLSCGHILEGIKCWRTQTNNMPECNFIGDITLPCNHTLKNAECREKESIKCTELIIKSMSRCEHTNNIQCSESSNDDIQCKKNCGKQLKCGHECLKACFKCQERSISQNFGYENEIIVRTNHGKCKTKCNKLLYCGHRCKQYCHEGDECRPCNDKCARSCEHTKKACNKNCSEPCAVCVEQCSWVCEHEKCELSCGIPCDNRLPCNERCNKKAKCGHNCAGICGEICGEIYPSYCANVECAPKKIKNQVSDIINNITFDKIDWNKERMIVLPCKHIYTMKSLDMLMEMGDYYEGSIDGRWTSVKIFPASTNIKTCPECQAPIKDIKRYGRIIKKCALEILNKKFISKYAKYDDELRKIAKLIVASFNKMETKRKKLRNELCDISELKTKNEFKDKDKTLSEITRYYYFECIAEYHGFDKNSQRVWVSRVKRLLNCYDNLFRIIRATKISPHKIANLNAEQGLTFMPKLDQLINSIYVDGVLKVINIQKILHNEILFIIEELSSVEKKVEDIKELWKDFAEKLQQSIQDHLRVIKDVTKSTNYGIHPFLVNLETVEIDMMMLKYPHKRNFISKAVIKKQHEGIVKRIADISDISKSFDYTNVEEELRKVIFNRIETLWENNEEFERENLKY